MNVKTITNERGTWLQHDLAISLGSEIEDIREELAELQARFERVMRDVRALPGGDWLYDRVDAYPGIRLDRDMGAGQDADGWLAEVATFLEPLGDPGASLEDEPEATPPTAGPQPPCPLCGSTATWHRCLGAELA
jgi:hypothetical protein